MMLSISANRKTPGTRRRQKSAKSYSESGFIVGKSRTSRMDGASVNSMTRRSMPMPTPPVGGRPYSMAVM